MKVYIKSSAMKRSDLGADLEEVAVALLEALGQLYLFPKCEYTHHWRQEVWTALHRLPKLKNNNKLPSKQFIINHTWEEYKGEMDYILICAREHEYLLTPEVDRLENVEEFSSICFKYLDWLSGILSSKSKVLPSEVYQKLKELNL